MNVLCRRFYERMLSRPGAALLIGLLVSAPHLAWGQDLPARIDALIERPALPDTLASVPPVGAERLTLGAAIRQALQNNYSVRIARNDAAIARNDATLGNAGFWPTLNASLSQQNIVGGGGAFGVGGQGGVGGGGVGGGVQGAGLDEFNTTTATATLSWDVFRGFGRFATYRRLKTQSLQGGVSAESSAETTLRDVVDAYYSVVRQRQLLGVVVSSVALSGERLRLASLQARVGTGSQLDADLARVDLNADRSELLRQDVALLNAKNTLSQLLADEGALQAFAVEDTIRIDEVFAYEAVLAEALDQNRALQVARLGRDAARESVREVRADYLPAFSVETSYQLLGFSEGATPDPFNQDDTFTYGFTMSLPLFEGFNRRRRAQGAQLDVESAELAIRETETRIRAEVQNAFQTFQSNRRLVQLERDNLEVARRNIRVAFRRLEVGTITPVELRDVQQTLLERENSLIEAAYQAKLSELTLQQLTGRLLDQAEALAGRGAGVREP